MATSKAFADCAVLSHPTPRSRPGVSAVPGSHAFPLAAPDVRDQWYLPYDSCRTEAEDVFIYGLSYAIHQFVMHPQSSRRRNRST